jgi:hypothetical protein
MLLQMFRLDFTKFWVFQSAMYAVNQYRIHKTPMPQEHRDMIDNLDSKFYEILRKTPNSLNFGGKTHSIFLNHQEALYLSHLLQQNAHKFPKLAALSGSIVQISENENTPLLNAA